MENEARGENTDHPPSIETAVANKPDVTAGEEPPRTRAAAPASSFFKILRQGAAFLYRNKGALLGIGLAIFLLLIPRPEGLSSEGQKALSLVSLAFVFFMTEPTPVPGGALLIEVRQVVSGLGKCSEVDEWFHNEEVLIIMGSLMIA